MSGEYEWCGNGREGQASETGVGEEGANAPDWVSVTQAVEIPRPDLILFGFKNAIAGLIYYRSYYS